MARRQFEEDRMEFRDAFMRDDDNGMRRVVARGSGHRRPPSNRGRGSQVRKQYQENRVVALRTDRSQRTQYDLDQDLKRRLYPGVKDGMDAMSRLEAINTFKAISICITTRAIGFGTAHIFLSLRQFNNMPVNGTVYQLYRMGLALFEAKMIISQRSVQAVQLHPDYYASLECNENLISTAKSMTMIPDQLSSVLNNIGQVKVGDFNYIPRLGKVRTTRNNRFIPLSNQITLSTLRQTVVALADGQTPAEYRRRFYRHNPIPGAIWNGDNNAPLLLNADEIMPAEYNHNHLRDDIDAMADKLSFLSSKGPKYYTKVVSFEPGGTKSMLVCNEQGTLRVANRNIGEGLLDYNARIKLEGDIEDFHNLQRLTSA